MKLWERILAPGGSERYTVDDVAEWFTYQGWQYPILGNTGPYDGNEGLSHSFTGYAQKALKRNGIVFACVAARMLLFSEVRFKYRRFRDGTLFGDPSLLLLERPEPNTTSGEMLARMEIHASIAGNWYGVRRVDPKTRDPLIWTPRPDWMTIVIDSPTDNPQHPDARVVGFSYKEPMGDQDPIFFDVSEVAHYAPIPDPENRHVGMSWITPIIEDVTADSSMTTHKNAFTKNAAVIPFALTYPPMSPEDFAKTIKAFKEAHAGERNAYRELHLAGGADVKPLGVDLRALDFKSVQGGGETRITAASRVPAVIAGISEGLAGSSLNAGNYSMARRQFGDLYARPHWRTACACLEKLVPAPDGTHLWYDDHDIAFLREDQKDAAEVIERQAAAIRQLVDGGFEPDTAVQAVVNGDLKQLDHTGNVSVQLQPPGTQPDGQPPPDDSEG